MGQKRNLDAAAQDASTGAQKRRRQYTEQDAKLASMFERLADEARETRLAAAKELVLLLSDEPSADVANKVLTRLIRGLCSSRKAARSGFFVAVSEIVRQLYGPSRKEIPDFEPNLHGLVKLVAELTKTEGKPSGQEKRDHLLGRVFGYKALIQSSILVQPTAPKECWTNVLEELYTISEQKPWVREECGMVFSEAVKAIHAENGDEKLVQEILHGLCRHGLAKTPEGVAIWLSVQSAFPKMELPGDVWHKQDPLCTKERQSLANVMKENFAKAQGAENGKKVKSGSSQTTLNFAWELVMVSFMQRHGAGDSGVSEFSKFWTDIVDNNLFSASASPEQKSKGLQLFSRVLASAPQWALLPLFSPNLMRCIINQRNGVDRYLHKAAQAPLDEMRARVKRNPEVAAPIIEGLVTRHGSLNFDKITKTKTVEGVLGFADGSALKELVVFFERLIYRPEDDEDQKAVETHRRVVSDMMILLVRSRNLENPVGEDDWLQTLLQVFTKVAYFTPTGSSQAHEVPVPSISEASRQLFQTRVTSCLAHLLSSKLDTEMAYPVFVVTAIQDFCASATLSLAFKADKTISKAVKQAHKRLSEILTKEAKAKEKKKPALRAFKLLYSLTIIQVYNGDADAVMILEELSECYGAAFQKGEKDANAFQLLTEVILGFAARPSVLFRKLSEQVFTVFASELTPEGLQSMIEILEKKESASGQQDLFDQQGSDVEEEEEDEEDEEVDSDVEVVDAEGSDVEMVENASEDDDDSGDDEGSEAGDEEGDDEELQKLDALLAETLKTSVSNAAGEDENDSDDDDADMDDDEMMALEPHLAKIFQERQKVNSRKKENKNAKENMINFKNRVLDLLFIYVKQQHSNPLAMDIIMPLLQLIRNTATKQISEKAFGVLRQYFDSAKKGMPEPPEISVVWAIFKDVHGEAAKDPSKLFAGACSRASLFLAKILVTKKDKNFKKIVDVYADTLKQKHEDPKSKIHPSFFTEWINWSFAPRKKN